MTTLASLWLPILASAVVVFLASSVIHMLLPWHKSDYPPMPREQEFRDAVRPLAIPPGDYMVPRAQSMDELKTDAFRAKQTEGPVVIMTVLPNGVLGMGRSLLLWFVYLLVVALFGAYVAGRALPPGADYMRVFQFVSATTFAAIAGGLWQMSIWYHRAMSITIKSTVDALIYAALMAGVFGWLWPQ
ncbi:MAG TPA: hypothetical protein VFT96_00590 [Gemmatimonadaceae bacterium]|nr:hypothetical protein [Gemmatimonadaceae bacterium]